MFALPNLNLIAMHIHILLEIIIHKNHKKLQQNNQYNYSLTEQSW